MIASHHAIVVPPECGFAIWWNNKYGSWSVGNGQPVEFIRDLSQSKKIETWNLDFQALLNEILDTRPTDYAALVALVYNAYARRQKPNFKRWGDKNNFHVRHVADIHALFPDALFIHIVRDGRDIACSYRHLNKAKIESAYAPKLPTNIDTIANEWRSNLEAVRADFRRLPAGQCCELRYEDLVRTPVKTLSELCDFMGESYDPQMLEYHLKNRLDSLEPSEFLQWKAKTLIAPDSSALGKFRTELTAIEINRFENIAGELLEEYRYI